VRKVFTLQEKMFDVSYFVFVSFIYIAAQTLTGYLSLGSNAISFLGPFPLAANKSAMFFPRKCKVTKV
jgi:hypothetical protein